MFVAVVCLCRSCLEGRDYAAAVTVKLGLERLCSLCQS